MGLDSLIVVNGEKFQSQAVTLILIGQCPMSNSSELFSYNTMFQSTSFKWIEPLFLSYHVHRQTHTDTQTDRYTPTHTDGHKYSIAAVDKPQL